MKLGSFSLSNSPSPRDPQGNHPAHLGLEGFLTGHFMGTSFPKHPRAWITTPTADPYTKGSFLGPRARAGGAPPLLAPSFPPLDVRERFQQRGFPEECLLGRRIRSPAVGFGTAARPFRASAWFIGSMRLGIP